MDGLYEGTNKSMESLFDYLHEDYSGEHAFDHYNAELLRDADFLLLSRNSFLANKAYWPGVPSDPTSTPIRREISGVMSSIEKIVISDKLTEAELAPWENTRIIKRADAYREIAALKAQPRQGHPGDHEPSALE